MYIIFLIYTVAIFNIQVNRNSYVKIPIVFLIYFRFPGTIPFPLRCKVNNFSKNLQTIYELNSTLCSILPY